MNKIYHKNIWRIFAVKNSCGSTSNYIIQSKLNLKKERDYVKIKLLRNPTSEKLDIYEFKINLFDNGKTE